jgi:hypothetical protein
MVLATGKDGINRILVYQNSILLVDKEDELTFIIDNEHLKYTVRFKFSDQGDKYSTSVWESKENRMILYQLNNWDSSSWVEISKPVTLSVPDEPSTVWIKFRNISNESKSYRQFDLTVWKEVLNG